MSSHNPIEDSLSAGEAAMLSGLHIVIEGNVVDGSTFYGPFKTGTDAIDWAEDVGIEDWHIAKLNSPEGV